MRGWSWVAFCALVVCAFLSLGARAGPGRGVPRPGPTPVDFGARIPPGTYALAELPVYACRRAPGPIRIDGVLDDRGWRGATSTGPFPNWDAHGLPEYPTEARLAWDAGALYVAFHGKDTDIFSPYTRRDEPLYNEDVVEVFLSLDGYPQRYFELEVSPANVLYDALVVNPGSSREISVDKGWNGPEIRTAVRIDGTLNRRDDRDRSWTVEMAIPFKDLGLERAPAPGSTWRVNLYRMDPSSENRYATWSPVLGTRVSFHRPERFGTLQFAP